MLKGKTVLLGVCGGIAAYKAAYLASALVKQHAEETGSQFAAALLEDWNETVKRFTHVVPKQFVAMTKAMEEAKANNVDFNAPGAWEKVYEQVMEGAR